MQSLHLYKAETSIPEDILCPRQWAGTAQQGNAIHTHTGKLSRAGTWQERWKTLGQWSQHSSSPPLRHTAQKSSFSIGLTSWAAGDFFVLEMPLLSFWSADRDCVCPAAWEVRNLLSSEFSSLDLWPPAGLSLFILEEEKSGITQSSFSHISIKYPNIHSGQFEAIYPVFITRQVSQVAP